MQPPLPKLRTPKRNEHFSRSGSPFRAKSPAVSRNQSPARLRDARTPEIRLTRGVTSPVGSYAKQKEEISTAFQSETFRSISIAEPDKLNVLPSPPAMPANNTTETKRGDETRDDVDVKQAGPNVNTTPEEWMDRSNSLSFVQSEVSFTPENALGKDDFGFERDFEGFGDIVTKNAGNSFKPYDIVNKPRAESFDWDTEFHRAASPFQASQDRQGCPQASLSLDEGLKERIQMTPTQSMPRDAQLPPPKRRDPSPMSAQRSTNKTSRVHGSSQSQGPQKTPPKAVPTNAILGSMLFRQTQTSSTSDQNAQGNGGSSQIGESRSKDATQTSFIGENRSRDTSSSMFSRKQSSFIAANRSNDATGTYPTKSPHQDRFGDKNTTEKIPRSVMAANDETDSIVSSVTEEASSFYKKSFGAKSPSWNQTAQTLLNNYNVRKNHVRTVNNSTYGARNHHTLVAHTANNGSFSRSEEEHVSVFLSEV